MGGRRVPVRGLAVCGMALALASSTCSSKEEAPKAPAPEGYTLASRAFVVSARQANEAVVSDDKIVFPKAGNEGLLARTAGDVIVGDRHVEGAATNRYGFLRKIAGVSESGDSIVVQTADDASLEDVFARASFNPKVKLNTFKALPPLSPPAGGSGSLIGTGLGPGLDVGAPLKPTDFQAAGTFSDKFGQEFGPIDILKFKLSPRKFMVAKKEVELAGEANAKLSEAKFIFTPTVDIGVSIEDAALQHFHVSLDGQVDIAVVGELDLSAGLTVVAGETDLATEEKEGLAARIAAEIAKSSSPPSFASPDLVRAEGAGPMLGPVPTTVEFSAKISCSFAVKGGIKGQVGIRTSSGMKAGVSYDRGKGWTDISEARLEVTPVGPEWTQVYGGAELKCGIQPRIAWKLAGAIGPYLQLEAGDKVSAEYTETCPKPPKPSRKPDAQLTLKNELYLEGAAGGLVKVLGREVVDLGRPIFPAGSFPLTTGTIDLGDGRVVGGCGSPPDAGPPAPGLDLSNPWTSVPIAVSPAAYVSSFTPSATSVTLAVEGWADLVGHPSGGCNPRQYRKVIPLGQTMSCSTATVSFGYSSSTTGEAWDLNNTGLSFAFSTAGDAGVAAAGTISGRAQAATTPMIQQGSNVFPLNATPPGGKGTCVGTFDTLTLTVFNYICQSATAKSSQTLSNLVITP